MTSLLRRKRPTTAPRTIRPRTAASVAAVTALLWAGPLAAQQPSRPGAAPAGPGLPRRAGRPGAGTPATPGPAPAGRRPAGPRLGRAGGPGRRPARDLDLAEAAVPEAGDGERPADQPAAQPGRHLHDVRRRGPGA